MTEEGTALETELARIRRLVEGRQPAEALQAGLTLLERAPASRDALYLVAVSQRFLGHTRDALATLERALALHPHFGRFFQERGYCLQTLGETDAAIRAFERAVSLNAALIASWKALAVLWQRAGDPARAQAAAHQVAQLSRLPGPVVSASGMLAEEDLAGAERVLRRFLQQHGDHPEAMRLLALIGARIEVLDDAELLLESALLLEPDYALARYDYAQVLCRRHRHAAAHKEVTRLLASDPGNRAYRTLHATICVGLGRHEEALAIYQELLAGAPEHAELHLSIAHALKTLGRQEEAVSAYRAAAAARPTFGDAWWSLANLKTYRFTDEELARMQGSLDSPEAGAADRYHLCFALGKAFEDRGCYEESFQHYARGNSLKKSETRHDPEALEQSLREQAALCTAEFLAARTGWGCQRPDPIFIVGLPRAGSTLIEQILASHSQVEGTMELADIARIALQLPGRGGHYPAALGELTSERCERLGEQYLEDTRILRGGRPFFIDKMPNNFRHIGLIHLILPNARIIDARREPMACCFSNFKQLFAAGQEFTYSLTDIARYYRAYVEMMAHWDRVLPGKILRVQHEELVEDLEGTVRRMLAFLGLPFEPACLEFHRTERSIRTASSEQVRRPINRDGLDQWRHFEPWLGPLREALAGVLG